jgi:hypothetical protein
MLNEELPFEQIANGLQIAILRNAEIVQCFCHYKERSKLLVEINEQTGITNIFPTNTIENSIRFLEPKYKINNFVFDGYRVKIDKNEYNDEDAIDGLPAIFTTRLEFGLGLTKQYRLIANIISFYFPACKTIVISRTQQTNIVNDKLIINDVDLHKICRGIDRYQNLYQKESREAKNIFIYDILLHDTNPERYPPIRKKSQKDVIYKILKNTDFKNSDLSRADKQSISALKDNTDLSYLTMVSTEFESKITGNHKESTYQEFFEENPFLLTIFAGSPYVKFQNQAYVGGKSFDNSNGKYPDFLLKHKATNNTFIIEIKKPTSLLLENKPYRGTDVYPPSNELSGAISQVLSQKYSLETDIASLTHKSSDREVEAYNVQGLIIIGRIEDLKAPPQKCSFELFRNNQKNIRITTYDECLEQLKSMIECLSKKLVQIK